MANITLTPTASAEEIENEIVFQFTLLETLDTESFSYHDDKHDIEEAIDELQRRLEQARMANQAASAEQDVQNRKRQRYGTPDYKREESDDDDTSSEERVSKSLRASPSAYNGDHSAFRRGLSSSRNMDTAAILERQRKEQRVAEERAKQLNHDAQYARQLSMNNASSSFTRPPPGTQNPFNRTPSGNLYQLQIDRNGQLPHSSSWRASNRQPTQPPTPHTPVNPALKREFNSPTHTPPYSPPHHTYATSPLHGDSPGTTPFQYSTIDGINLGQATHLQSPLAHQASTFNDTLPIRSPQFDRNTTNGSSSHASPNGLMQPKPEPTANHEEGWRHLTNGWTFNNGLYYHPSYGFKKPPEYQRLQAASRSMPGGFPSQTDTSSDSSLEEIDPDEFRPSVRSQNRPQITRVVSRTNQPRSGYANGLAGIGAGILNTDLGQGGANGSSRRLPWMANSNSGPNPMLNQQQQYGYPQYTIQSPLGYPGYQNPPHLATHAQRLLVGSLPRNGGNTPGSAGLSTTNMPDGDGSDRYNYLYSDPTRTAEEINKLLESIRSDEDLPPEMRKGTPEDMSATLLEHQKLGLTWLIRQEEGHNKGGILADDMGLGKTIQAISLMVSRKSEDLRHRTTLVLAPVALLQQWEAEIKDKIKPGRRLSVYRYHGNNATTKTFDFLRQYDVVLTTYGTLGSQWKRWYLWTQAKKNNPHLAPLGPAKIPLIADGSKWHRVILDEAQNIKNKIANAAKGAYLLQSTYRLCMTGTPMMNNVGELFSLIHFCRIRPFCEWEKFNNEIGKPLGLTSSNDTVQKQAMQRLRGLIKATMLRRTKKSTLDGKPLIQLPERIVDDERVEFDDDEEKEFYTRLEKDFQVIIKNFMKKGVLGKKYSNALVLLLRLRQACCHRNLVLFSESANTMTQLDVPIEQALELAKELSEEVVNRIKGLDGAFQCPICLDGTENPALLLPCGHPVCSECFTQLRDSNQNNMEGEVPQVRCPICREVVIPSRITDYTSFKKIHQPELVPPEETSQALVDSETDSDDSDSDSDTASATSESDSLGGFIVNADEVEEEGTDGINEDSKDGLLIRQFDSKPKLKTKSKKDKKGKSKEKIDPGKSLAQLKKEGMRNMAARRIYFKQLKKDYKPSAKIVRTIEMLQEIQDEHPYEKVLIFSQFTTLLDILTIPLKRGGFTFERYDGSMSSTARASAVERFRRSPNIKILLVSLKAGNAGLNLNCASRVIIMDPFWNPYVEDQAIDRAHRIGQMHDVVVRRVVVPETVEDRILTLQERKKGVINSALDENAVNNIARLGQRELAYLFGIGSLPPSASAPAARNGTGVSASNAVVL